MKSDLVYKVINVVNVTDLLKFNLVIQKSQ